MESYVYGDRRALPDGFDLYADRGAIGGGLDRHAPGASRGHARLPLPGRPGRAKIVAPIDAFSTTRRAGSASPSSMSGRCCGEGGVDDVNGLRAAWRACLPRSMSARSPTPTEHAIEGSRWTEFETRVEPGDQIVQTKKRLSVFYPTDLDFLLRNMGIRTVVLNGGFTDCCVLNAAFDASNRDYRVVVLQRPGARHQ